MATLAKRNLPHDTTYSLVSTFATGGLDNGCPCDNCGKMLTNVAVVQDATGKQHNVGLDCAATLATVNPLEFDAASDLFNTAKKVKRWIVKDMKEYGSAMVVSCGLLQFGDKPAYYLIEGHLTRTDQQTNIPASYYGRRFSSRHSMEEFNKVIKPILGALIPTVAIEGSKAYEAHVAQLMASDAAYHKARLESYKK